MAGVLLMWYQEYITPGGGGGLWTLDGTVEGVVTHESGYLPKVKKTLV